ncbi:MAG: transglycosylase domain-containing protein, partial [Pseudomonadota bacterium]
MGEDKRSRAKPRGGQGAKAPARPAARTAAQKPAGRTAKKPAAKRKAPAKASAKASEKPARRTPARKPAAAKAAPRLSKSGSRTAAPRRKPAAARSGAARRGKRPVRQGFRIRPKTFLGHVAYWTAVLGTWSTLCVIGLVAWHVSTLPPLRDLRVPERPPNLTILASDGTEIANRGRMGGARVRLADMPPHLPAAVLATEDRRFYSHFGLDAVGLTRAVILNLAEGKVGQGGSTLTQQLAKNLFLKPDRTLARKLREAMLALWLEAKFSKDEILEMYLNRAYFGAGAYGVEAAARRYFNRGARDLDLGQSALLAGLLKAPASLAPTRAPERALARTRVVLTAMARGGVADPIGVRAAMETPYTISPPPRYGDASYAADWVQEEIERLVGALDRDVVVETSLDLTMQAKAQAALEMALNEQGRSYGVSQGAIVVMAPDGRVRAMVGGRDYAASQFNRAAS